jgi:hypothetical protein
MSSTGRAIQGLVIFSTILGVLFLWLAYPLLQAVGFYFVAFGWVLFVVDSVLTFVRPRISYYLGFVLALIALFETVSRPEHLAILQGSNLLASATLVLGSAAQVLLLILVPLHFIRQRREKAEWAWPGAKSQA